MMDILWIYILSFLYLCGEYTLLYNNIDLLIVNLHMHVKFGNVQVNAKYKRREKVFFEKVGGPGALKSFLWRYKPLGCDI